METANECPVQPTKILAHLFLSGANNKHPPSTEQNGKTLFTICRKTGMNCLAKLRISRNHLLDQVMSDTAC
jgi:hypothetical protein